MARHSAFRLVGVCALVLLVGIPQSAISRQATPEPGTSVMVEILANGLTNPRGFAWDADGALHLALAGAGGETASSIVTVADGCVFPLAEELPTLFVPSLGWVWGVMDLAFAGEELYALSGAWNEPTGIYRVHDDGSWEIVADLGAWFSANPTSFIAPDYNPLGSLFDLVTDGESFWVSEAVGGRLMTAAADGRIELVADLSEGHQVPTGVAPDGDGGAYVGFLTSAPYPDDGSKVVHVAADGAVTVYWTGLTVVTDVAMGPDGTLYAAEMATGNTAEAPFLTPKSGRVVRMTGPDSLEPVVVDMDAPGYLGFDTDGALYVTLPAYAPDTGVGFGSLVRVEVSGSLPISLAGLNAEPTCAVEATPAA
jgi:hypothetical protein